MANTATLAPIEQHADMPAPYRMGCRKCLPRASAEHRTKSADLMLAILAIMCPPAVAWIRTGKHDLGLNFILTILGWAPGIFHAWYLLAVHPPKPHGYDYHHVVYVNQADVETAHVQQPRLQQPQLQVMGDTRETVVMPVVMPQSPRMVDRKEKPPGYRY